MKKHLREGGCSEVVADLELPHTSQDLDNASVEDSQTSDNLNRAARGDTSTEVEERKHD